MESAEGTVCSYMCNLHTVPSALLTRHVLVSGDWRHRLPTWRVFGTNPKIVRVIPLNPRNPGSESEFLPRKGIAGKREIGEGNAECQEYRSVICGLSCKDFCKGSAHPLGGYRIMKDLRYDR